MATNRADADAATDPRQAETPHTGRPEPDGPGTDRFADDAVPATRMPFATLAAITGIAAILHFGAAIFAPLAIAMLITFALSPLVGALRSRGIGMLAAVLLVVTVAFMAIGTFLLTVGGRLVRLIEELPKYQGNIEAKLDALPTAGTGQGALGGLARLLGTINAQVAEAVAGGARRAPDAPVKVDVVEDQSLPDMLQTLVLPVISPLATIGLVAVVVIFMLLERNSLRDRFIRLVGTNDLHRTTAMLDDAGSRVGQYLIMQFLVNVIYAVPITLGLWLIGVPQPLLWGLLTLVLRFVPYIGSALAAVFPLFLAIAAAPGWSMLAWTAVLFVVVELVTSNVIEPMVYGSRTGVSPLAIIVSAIVWAWIWGPVGLVLSTPLTVCLVVLGRYLPQFAVFDILFGDQPALLAHAQLYQRLLVGDVVETSHRAEEMLEDMSLGEFYRDIGIPALLLAQADYDRGVLTAEQENRLAEAAAAVVRDLEPFALPDAGGMARRTASGDLAPGPFGTAMPEAMHPAHETPRPAVVFIGGRRRMDDVAAAMLRQVLTAGGVEARALTRAELAQSRFAAAARLAEPYVVVVFLDPEPSRASLLQVRRLRRAAPQLRVGVFIWQARTDAYRPTRTASSKLAEAKTLGADFVAQDADGLLAILQSHHEPLPGTDLLRSGGGAPAPEAGAA